MGGRRRKQTPPPAPGLAAAAAHLRQPWRGAVSPRENHRAGLPAGRGVGRQVGSASSPGHTGPSSLSCPGTQRGALGCFTMGCSPPFAAPQTKCLFLYAEAKTCHFSGLKGGKGAYGPCAPCHLSLCPARFAAAMPPSRYRCLSPC